MKKYQMWVMGELACMSVSAVTGVVAGVASSSQFKGSLIPSIIGVAVCGVANAVLLSWYHSKTTMAERFHGAEDSVDE